MDNALGSDGSAADTKQPRQEWREADGLRGLAYLPDPDLDRGHSAWGDIAVATPDPGPMSHQLSWPRLGWGDALLRWWEDLLADGRLEPRAFNAGLHHRASLTLGADIPAGGVHVFTLLLAWRFPNRRAWDAKEPVPVGNHYCTRFPDAWSVLAQVQPRLEAWETGTQDFLRAFCASDLPAAAKEAAFFNLSTLRSQTLFRTADGLFMAWEGCHDRAGCCHGTCTHVWNYDLATPFLFGAIARSQRTVEFARATDDAGLMSFRVNLPIDQAQSRGKAAADGQLGCLIRCYREWRLSGDDDLLRALWPKIRRSLEFCWLPGGWDADRDGVMEGCQHNTMDVEYFGPNPQMQLLYLGALRCVAAMAEHQGETAFAAECRTLAAAGAAWMDEHLFNCKYYERAIQPPAGPEAIRAGLLGGMGSKDLADPDCQLGAGCLVDQLLGQVLADSAGLGDLADPVHLTAAAQAVFTHNRRQGFFDHFNPMRSFVFGEECALLMASYPRGSRPRVPFPYFTEAMTGFEYVAALALARIGRLGDALAVVADIRDRYDGAKRSPFNEAECGHHYGRTLASWGLVNAWSGFRYDAVDGRMAFARPEKPVRWFWASGDAWGTTALRPQATGVEVSLRVLHGRLRRLEGRSGRRVRPA